MLQSAHVSLLAVYSVTGGKSQKGEQQVQSCTSDDDAIKENFHFGGI